MAAMKTRLTNERIKKVMEEVDALDLPDDLHWAIVHQRLGLDYGEVFEIIARDMTFFGIRQF